MAEVVPGRECRSCMMCCKVLAIKDPELEKPPGIWCQHAVAGKGCGTYDHRPGLCRRFYCHWMINPALGPEWKPDRAKFVLYGDTPSTKRIDIAVDPAFPNAWMKEPFFAMIKKWISDGIERDLIVMVQIGPRYIAVLPNRIVDLGKVDTSEKVSMKRTMGENGLDYQICIGSRVY
ncbi:MAG TPA: hypothetical protein VKW08_20000 [Xanthobacteraceae bacterium]|nr:hypothetical protein [Xanthobacteraceae bacterium]